MKNDHWPVTQSPRPEPSHAIHADRGSGISPEQAAWLEAKVMLVDDEPLMTELIQAHLEEAGYRNFVVCNDPRLALARLRREKPDLLLLDLMMPEVSGFQLLEAMRRDDALRFTPVIVLTAATGADAKLQALQLGATDFLGKPVDASELALRVRNTLAFQRYHERLRLYDRATGLPGDSLFEASLDRLLVELAQQGGPDQGLTALYSISVPECQQVRESVNRATADALAQVITRRLEGLTVPGEGKRRINRNGNQPVRLARLSEQQFAVLAPGLANSDAVELLAKQLLASICRPVVIGSFEITPMPWIGVAVVPGDGREASTLRQSADLAAAHGRRQGAAAISYAAPELNAKSSERLQLGAQLRNAAQRNELRLHYQPKVSLTTGHVVGLEALVRWQHPERGLMPPGLFIPLAEELGLINTIGHWVLEQACRDAARWARDGLGEIKVAINVARPQFSAGNLDTLVRQALFDSGLPARQLLIELTESMLMSDVDQAIALMHELKKIGVTLSIDDFGTGYSSLSYLKRFPLDELKIDRSFVVDLPGKYADQALVHTIISLGHSLGMKVIAEGVETEAQRDCLKHLGCDNYQGFLFSRPLPVETLEALLSKGRKPRNGAQAKPPAPTR